MTQAPGSRWWRWRPSLRRDLLTVAIEHGADADGCAVCWVLAKRERRSLWILLWEHVLDPDTRGEWNRTLGFCARHTSALCATATRMGQVPPGRTRGRAKGSADLPASCPLCVFVDARARELTAGVGPGDSEAALCLRHMELALPRPSSVGGGSAAFRAAHVEPLRALSHELHELHRKSAWDARNEPKGSEQTSWIRAAHYLSYDA